MEKDYGYIDTMKNFIKKYAVVTIVALTVIMMISPAFADGGRHNHHRYNHGGHGGYHWGAPLAGGFIGGFALGAILSHREPVYVPAPYYYVPLQPVYACTPGMRGEWRTTLDIYGNPVNQYICY